MVTKNPMHFQCLLTKNKKTVPGISGNLVVKSKLSPRSGSSLEVVEAVKAIKSKFYLRIKIPK